MCSAARPPSGNLFLVHVGRGPDLPDVHILGGDLFEDDKPVVVRLEVPGMDKNDLDTEVQGGALIVRGEKRFEKEGLKGVIACCNAPMAVSSALSRCR